MAKDGIISDGSPTKATKFATLSNVDLKIPSTLFNDEAIQHLIDDWVVPALVDEFLRCHNKLPSSDAE